MLLSETETKVKGEEKSQDKKNTMLEHLQQRQRRDVDLLRGVYQRRVRMRSSHTATRTPCSWENPVQPGIHWWIVLFLVSRTRAREIHKHSNELLSPKSTKHSQIAHEEMWKRIRERNREQRKTLRKKKDLKLQQQEHSRKGRIRGLLERKRPHTWS